MQTKGRIEILVVEDDEGHAKLILEGLRHHVMVNEVYHVLDGQSALDFVEDQSPHLILLDLNIPKVHGFEVLKRLKSDDRFKKIPVMIITSIDDQREVNKAYELGANTYITKPIDFSEFEKKLKSIGFFIDSVSYPE